MNEYSNVCMTLCHAGVRWHVTALTIFANQAVELALVRADGLAHTKVTAPGLEALEGPMLTLQTRTAGAVLMERVMRRPWRYDQMLRAKVDPENSLGSVTNIESRRV